jgi:hypothetical protein
MPKVTFTMGRMVMVKVLVVGMAYSGVAVSLNESWMVVVVDTPTLRAVASVEMEAALDEPSAANSKLSTEKDSFGGTDRSTMVTLREVPVMLGRPLTVVPTEKLST